MREVAIIGTGQSYDEPQDNGVERWVCNGALYTEYGADRWYWMDRPEHLDKSPYFKDAMADYKGQIFTQTKWTGYADRVTVFPLSEIQEMDPGAWFTSTIAYMIAHAIYEGVDRIYMHGLHKLDALGEYHAQKACLDYWIGFGRGKGIDIVMTGESQLAQPFPKQSAFYGYEEDDQQEILREIVMCASGLRMEDVLRTYFAWDKPDANGLLYRVADYVNPDGDRVTRYELKGDPVIAEISDNF